MTRIPTIFLIGPRASGKTTLGTALARELSVPFADTDAWVQTETGLSIAELVERSGWAEFRRLESLALQAVGLPGQVAATGGGMVLAEENRLYMRTHGLVIYLEAPEEALTARLAASPLPGQRPSLTGEPALVEAARVAKERAPLYQSTAHHTLDASLPLDALLRAALRLIRQ